MMPSLDRVVDNSCEPIVIPPLDCSISSAVNPHVEAIEERTIEWASVHGLTPDDLTKRKLREAQFGWLGARTKPHDELDRVSLATDWCTWMFFHDDFWCDDVATKRRGDLRRFAEAHQQFMDILNGVTDRTERLSPLDLALADIRQRLLERTSVNGLQPFIRSVKDYFEGNFWEVSNYAQGIIPDVATYSKVRPFAGGAYTAFAITCLEAPIQLNPEVQDHLFVRQLSLLANNCVTWVNDLFFLQKEIKEGNMNNLVLAIQHERQCSLQTAVDVVAELCNAEMRAFTTLASRLPSVPALNSARDRDLQRYVALLQSWIRGNLDWSIQTRRYSGYTVQPSRDLQ